MNPAPPVRLRQPWLFPLSGPLTERLGPAVFAALPEQPGVYRFFGEENRLLYIGQSSNLRHRVGSYRFVTAERHTRRMARMVARVRRVEWEICETAQAAVERERTLLLEHRPPFNRAGVWAPPPWWVVILQDADTETFSLRLSREEPEADVSAAGPLPGAFRYTFAALVRCVLRWHRRDMEWWHLPCGMAGPVIPPEQSLSGAGTEFITSLHRFLTTGCPVFLEELLGALPDAAGKASTRACWDGDVEALTKFSQGKGRVTRNTPGIDEGN